MSIESIQEKVYNHQRISTGDALSLFESPDIFAIGKMASFRCEAVNGKNVYYIRNRHINPTNLCVNRCVFCAFSRSKHENGAYEMDADEIIRTAVEAAQSGVRELHIVGGLHPDWRFDFYLNILRKIKNEAPELHIKAFTAVEIDYMSKISGYSVEKTLTMLQEAGLGTMPGGGAEIFENEVRKKICPEKISGKRWLEIMEIAHCLGVKTNSTMLYGHIETYRDRALHLEKLRALQDKTQGFQAFVALSFHSENTAIKGVNQASGLDDLKTIAISRIFLDNIPNIKAYWIMLGPKLAQVALYFGANDLDGTVLEEKITRSAGGTTQGILTETELKNIISKAGKNPVERDSLYRVIS
jgi:aminodeoxyfutalosine synthase